MEFLPTEVLTEILLNLDMNMILRCRQVSRKWKFVVENNVKFQNLSVKSPLDSNLNDRYAFTFRSTNKDVLFLTKNFNFFQASFFRTNIIKNLKRLYLSYTFDNYEFMTATIFTILVFLNQYEKLEQLEIETLQLEVPAILRLPNLKYLSIDEYEGQKLTLETPVLHSFKIKYGYNNIEFKDPSTIRSLSLMDFIHDVTKFVNLEFLYLKYLEDDTSEEEDETALFNLLRTLPNLKEFHCSSESAPKEIVYNIMLDKGELKRSNFQFYYAGIRLDNIHDLDELAVGNSEYLIDMQTNFQFILRNFSKLSKFVPWINQINYSELIKHFNDKIENNFIDRFFNINSIVVRDAIKNQEYFIEFIKRFPCLNHLELSRSLLDQKFYDQLMHCQNLERLEIEDFVKNFHFVTHLNKLRILTIHQQVSFDLVEKVLSELKSIYRLNFLINGKYIKIYSVPNGSNHEIEFSNECIKFPDKKHLLKFIENLIGCFE